MSLKMVTYRLDEDTLKELKNVCNYLGINQADFIREAIREKLDRVYIERSGGAVFNIPNPRIFSGTETMETMNDIIDAFDDLDRKIRRASLGFRNFIKTKDLSEFIETRLTDDQETMERFQNEIEYLNGKPIATADWISDSEA